MIAPRIVKEASCHEDELCVLLFVVGAVFGEGQVLLCVAGAVFGEGQVLLFVAGAALGECLNVRLASKRCILQ